MYNIAYGYSSVEQHNVAMATSEKSQAQSCCSPWMVSSGCMLAVLPLTLVEGFTNFTTSATNFDTVTVTTLEQFHCYEATIYRA